MKKNYLIELVFELKETLTFQIYCRETAIEKEVCALRKLFDSRIFGYNIIEI